MGTVAGCMAIYPCFQVIATFCISSLLCLRNVAYPAVSSKDLFFLGKHLHQGLMWWDLGSPEEPANTPNRCYRSVSLHGMALSVTFPGAQA